MTPKGSVTPHSRFGVSSRKAEVLFLDYILEHLNADVRAGVIVPEGIMFVDQGAGSAIRCASSILNSQTTKVDFVL